MLNDLDVCGVNVRVGVDKVVANNGGKLLGRVDGVLLCENVGSLLLGVCCDNDRIIGSGIAVLGERLRLLGAK